ncbi:MAG TPA: hypothetical protein V6D43_21740 [Candidatus Sericytochromatia bacterium]
MFPVPRAIAHSRQTQPLLHSPHPDSLVLIATNQSLPISTEGKAIHTGGGDRLQPSPSLHQRENRLEFE